MATRPSKPLLRGFPFTIVVALLTSIAVTACRSDALGPTLDFGDVLDGDLQISPTELMLSDGGSGWLSLHLLKSDGTLVTSLPGGAKVVWQSSAPGIASVSDNGTVTAKQPGSTQITAKLGTRTVMAPVIVMPTASDLRPLYDGEIQGTVGASLQDAVGVRVVDRGGLPVSGIDVSFSVALGGGSVYPATAVTGSDGSARVAWQLGTQAGENALVASADGLADVILRARADANGDEDQLELIGGDNQEGVVDQALPQRLRVKVVDRYGNVVPNAAVQWIFRDGRAAGASSAGGGGANLTMAAAADGTAETTWQLGQQSGDQLATAKLPSSGGETWFKASAKPGGAKVISVSPSSATLGVGDNVSLNATVIDKFGNPSGGGSIKWSSSNPAVATVDSRGTVRGAGVGQADIVAKSGKVTGSARITVQAARPSNLSMVSGNGQSGSVGGALPQPFVVKVLDGSGSPMSGVDVAWSVQSGGGEVSSNATKTDGSGLARVTYTLGEAAGVNQVKAMSGSLSPLTFTATAAAGGVVNVQVTPGSASIGTGQTLQMYATALDAAGNAVSGATFTWGSTNTGVATIGSSGKVTGKAAGSTTIRATSGSVSGTAAVAVTRDVSRVAITSSPATLNSIGDTAYYQARAFDASGAVISGMSFTWTSMNPGVASVDQLGRVMSKAVGIAMIAAAASGHADTAQVTSQQVLAAVRVSPASPQIDVGASLQMQATPADSNGVAIPGVAVVWASSNASVATVSGGGVLQGVSGGSAQITASASSSSSSSGEGGSSTGDVSKVVTVAVQGSGSPPPPPPPPPPSGNDPTLPQLTVQTGYVQPTGNTIRVAQGGDLQAALNSAQRGDIIKLAPGAVFTAGYTLPAKPGSGWITITTDVQLPPEGTRMTPAIAASLNLARIENRTVDWNAAIETVNSANSSYYRIMGLEITFPDRNSQWGNGGIMNFGRGQGQTAASTPHHIIVDRAWIHGYMNRITKRCVTINSAWTAVVDSYLDHCHSNKQDSQAILGWNTPGPIKIHNNYLAGAGENTMFGGADPSISNLVPSDITITGNHYHKPSSWHGASTVMVKNLFELKNSRRVLVEGNIFEGNWVNGQSGYAFNLKSANQTGACTWCVTEHVTIRNNVIRNSTSAVSILGGTRNNLKGTNHIALNNVLFEDNIFVDLGPDSDFGGKGDAVQIVQGPASVSFRNNTWLNYYVAVTFAACSCTTDNFVFTGNIIARGQYGIRGDGAPEGTVGINQYAPGSTITGNLIVGANASIYPAGNLFPTNMSAVGFANLATRDLRVNGQYAGYGADAARVAQMTAGVR